LGAHNRTWDSPRPDLQHPLLGDEILAPHPKASTNH
jgi:hypothetical protein